MALIARYDFENDIVNRAYSNVSTNYITQIETSFISVPSYATSVDVLVVGGGGGGGGGYQGGGGGGGGVVYNRSVSTIAGQSLAVVVGDGGTGVAASNVYPTNGFDSALCYAQEYSINSDFLTSASGWSSQSSASNTWNSTGGRITSGCVAITSSGASNIYNSFGPNTGLVIGKQYIITAWIKGSVNSYAYFGIGSTLYVNDIMANQTLGVTTAYKQLSYVFTATSTSVYFTIYTPNIVVYIANVYIKQAIYYAQGGGLGANEIQAMSMSPNYNGNAGASGGGGSHGAPTLAGGTGISGQGYAGGTGWSAANQYMGAGGGGAGSPGQNASATYGGYGGSGLYYMGAWYGIGGGGSSRGNTAGPSGTSGMGTLGYGNATGTGNGIAGLTNTGMGGGAGGAGGGVSNGGNGGSGVVVLRWTLSDADIINNTVNQSYNTGVNYGGTFVSGKVNTYGIHFSGTQYAQIPISQFGVMNEITVSCWVKLDSLTSGYQQLFMAENPEDGLSRFNCHYNWSGTQYWDWGNINTSSARVSYAITLDTNWNLFTLTAGQAGMFIYKNGEVQTNLISAFYQQANLVGKILTLGNVAAGAYPLNGTIDDFRIYNHQMTQREAFWHYHTSQISARQLIEINKGMISHWDFNNFQEPTSTVIGQNLSVYNNFGMPATIIATGETYKNQSVYRVIMIPASQGQVDDFNNGFGNHGVVQNSISWTAYVTMCASIYWKPYSHVGSTYIDGSPSNQAGWYGHYTEDQGDGWFRSVSLHYTTTTQSDQKFWGAKTSGMTLGQWFICDFSCANVEQKDHVTPFSPAGARAGIVLDTWGRNHITLQPTTSPQWTSNSKFGAGCYYFNGSTSRMDVMYFNYTNFTISMWVNPDSTQNQYADIFDANHSGSNLNFVLQQNSTTTNQYYFALMGNYPSPIDTSDFFNIPSGSWNHLVVAVGLDSVKVYLNNVIVSNHARRGEINYTNCQLTFGSHYTITGRNWKGYMDDVRLWGRQITASEVSDLYSNTYPMQIDNQGNIWTDNTQHQEGDGTSIFLSNGTFVVPSSVSTVEVLVVAGGGGGGTNMGGGGGGGGVLYQANYSVTPNTSMPVVVGLGGRGAPAGATLTNPAIGNHPTLPATNGGNSSFGTLIAIGGGSGGTSYNSAGRAAGGTGGSGGGAAGYNDNSASPGATAGGAPTSGQGYRGGNQGNAYYSGGGGGAGGPGADGNNQANGGIGYLTSILGVPMYFAGGGGGAGYSIRGGDGGLGGGGAGAVANGGANYGGRRALNSGQDITTGVINAQTNTAGGNAGAYTGGGGGGGSHYDRTNPAGDGGSGIVIIRYAAQKKSFSISPTKSILNLPITGPTDKLIGYWPLMRDSNDYSGNKFHAIMMGANTTPRALGINGNNTFDLPGTAGNYFKVPYLPSVQGAWSVGGWLLKTAHNPSSYPIFLSFNLPYISCDSSSSGFRLSYYNGGQVNITGSTVVQLNTWYHVFATGNGNNVKLYVNGALEASATNMNSLGGDEYSNQLEIGRQYLSDAYVVAGRICEVRYYGRELTDSEVYQLYNYQTPSTTVKLGQQISYNKLIGR